MRGMPYIMRRRGPIEFAPRFIDAGDDALSIGEGKPCRCIGQRRLHCAAITSAWRVLDATAGDTALMMSQTPIDSNFSKIRFVNSRESILLVSYDVCMGSRDWQFETAKVPHHTTSSGSSFSFEFSRSQNASD